MNDSSQPVSLYQQHLLILGYDKALDQNISVEEIAGEERRCKNLKLPPLNLPEQKPSKRPQLYPIAAVLLVSLVPLTLIKGFDPFASNGPAYRIKGAPVVQVFWERQGVVQKFVSGTTLKNGDRVRAEVLTPVDSAAYLLVTDANGNMLSPSQQVLDGALRLEKGAKRSFPGSLELVGISQGEQLLVVVCPDSARSVFKKLILQSKRVINSQSLPKPCYFKEFRLR